MNSIDETEDAPAEAVQRACDRHHNRPDALIEILHDVQAELGCIPDAAVPPLALALNLSRADVHGVISFYHDFRRRPGGRHRLRLCRAEACQSLHSEALARHAERCLNVGFGETTADGRISLESAYCLGNCALGPAALLDDRLLGRLDPQKLERLIQECRSAAHD